MDSATAERSQATTEAPAQTAPTGAPPTNGSGGFALDPFLDQSTTTGTPGAGGGKSKIAGIVGDLRAACKQQIARSVDFAAPSAGSEMEMSLTVRVPVWGIYLTGKLTLTASRDTDGKVTATACGALGFSISDGATAFGNLLGSATIQGEGADATRAVEMMTLGLETFLRGLSNEVIIGVGARLSPLLTLVLAGIANACGTTIGNALCNAIWGKGSSDAILKGMKDGEATEIAAGGTLGFEVSPETGGGPELSVSGEVGAVVKQRIEKTGDAPPVTTETGSLTMAGELSVGPGTGGFELDVPMQPAGGGTLGLTASFMIGAEKIRSLDKFTTALLGGIAGIQQALVKSPDETKKAAANASGSLDLVKNAIRPAMSTATDTVLRNLDKIGLEPKTGLEITLDVDFGAKTATMKASIVTEVAVEGPLGNDAGVTKKLMLGEGWTFPIKK
jgi:hypothetical protein